MGGIQSLDRAERMIPRMGDWIGPTGARLLGRRPFECRSRKYPAFGAPTRVEHIQFDFRQWDGPITLGRGGHFEHMGKKRGQVHSLDRTQPCRSCNEVEVAKRLRTVRDNAFWFSQYGGNVPEIWQPWANKLG